MRWTLPIALLTLASCGYVLHLGESHGFSENNGVVSYDGVVLPYHRWVEVTGSDTGSRLQLATGTGPITLAGSETLHLEVDLYSEVENDGSVALDAGKPVTTSAAGRVLAINGVRGTIGPGLSLDLDTGTGRVELQDLPDAHLVEVDTGTGDTKLGRCKVADLRLNAGTAGLELEGCTLDRLKVDSGTGDVRLRASRVKESRISSGTGDVFVSADSDLGKADCDLGTGQLRHDG
jgi:hypothetical protein